MQNIFRYYEFLSKIAKCMALVWSSCKRKLFRAQIEVNQSITDGQALALMTGKNSFLRIAYEPEVKDQGDRVSHIVSHARPWCCH